ncbi:MAG: nuclear transport factor 2 family protein [Solirubrobacterales bacterium]
MSSDVDWLRATFERFNETGEMDFSRADPEIELHSRPDVPDATVWRGVDGVRGFFERTAESFDPIRWEPREFTEHGRHVVVRCHIVAYGAASGAPIEIDEAQLWTFRDGLLIRIQGFPTIDEAYAAARELDADAAT